MNNMFLGTLNQIISIVLILIILIGIFYLHKNVLSLKNDINRQKIELNAYKQTLEKVIQYYQSNNSFQQNIIDVDTQPPQNNIQEIVTPFENQFLNNQYQQNNIETISEDSEEDEDPDSELYNVKTFDLEAEENSDDDQSGEESGDEEESDDEEKAMIRRRW